MKSSVCPIPIYYKYKNNDITSMPVTVQYTVLKDKTRSQNNSRDTGISYHSLIELRTNSAVQELWKHKKKKICNVNLPLANECSNFETFFFNFILEWRLLFCIPETSELIITSIITTLHLLPRMLLNWFFSLLDSLYCNKGRMAAIKHNFRALSWTILKSKTLK